MRMFCDETGNIVESNILVKISKIKYLEEIRSGKLYMKTLEFHRKNEKEGVGDDEEGMLMHFPKATLKIDGIEVGYAKDCKMYILGDRPVFCCLNVELERVSNNNFVCVIDKQLLADFVGNDEEYGFIVINKGIFRERVSKALEKLNLMGWMHKVTYSDKIEKPSKEEIFRVAFRKRSRFEYQHEYRLVIDEPVVDHFVLDVGDLSDISKILTIKEIGSDIKIEVELYESNER